MKDKYVKLADVKRKLRYIFKAYGVGGFVREKVESALNNLPYSVKGDLETTLEVADVQPVKRGRWEFEHYNELIECYVANCSECGYESTDKYRITSNHRNCEYCGARMDLKDGDAE